VKIAIDIQTTLGQKSGFGFYVENLIKNLKKVDPPSGMHDDYVLIWPKTHKDFSTPERWFWDQYTFPKIARKARVDILHQPCFSAPIFYRGKIVITVHDIISIKFPQNLPLASRIFYSKWMPFSYRKAKMIIAVSLCTKKDMIEYLKIPEEKIRVVHSAVSEDFRPKSPKEIAKVKAKYKIEGDYFIDVGTIEPRKNLSFLVKAYFLAVKQGMKEKLVIVGKKGWYYEDLFELVKKLHLEDKIIFTGYADDKDTPVLYSGAKALVFPSLYEGFGFTPLEAMACGVPVIVSNTSSIPEVVGKAGILLAPKNEAKWAKEMIRLTKDSKLAKNLSQKGILQARKFSWKKTARETIEVYKAAFKNES
jgi:glycosyltransferase involved in cell wall biosynthesis